MLQKSKNPNWKPARKGKAWLRKTYKRMLVNECKCGTIMVLKTASQKCDSCRERERMLSRTRDCPSCESTFMLHDHQHGTESVCPSCRESDWKFLYNRIYHFINHSEEYFPNLVWDRKVHRFALKSRNDVQSVTDYRNFKMYHLKFKNSTQRIPTMDHINAMTHIIETYIRGCISERYQLDFENFKEYLFKYGVQFPVTQQHNLELREFQARGITPEEYISVVGALENHTIKETIEVVRPHFIHG